MTYFKAETRPNNYEKLDFFPSSCTKRFHDQQESRQDAYSHNEIGNTNIVYKRSTIRPFPLNRSLY